MQKGLIVDDTLSTVVAGRRKRVKSVGRGGVGGTVEVIQWLTGLQQEWVVWRYDGMSGHEVQCLANMPPTTRPRKIAAIAFEVVVWKFYGFFAPGNESAEERKGLESFIISHMTSKHILTKDQLPCRLLSFYILTFIYHDDVQTTVYIRAAPLNKYSSSSLNNRQLPVILMVMSVCVWLWGWTVGYIYIMTDSAGCRLYDTKSTLYDCYLYGYMYFGLLLCLAACFIHRLISPMHQTCITLMHVWCIGEINRWIKQRSQAK